MHIVSCRATTKSKSKNQKAQNPIEEIKYTKNYFIYPEGKGQQRNKRGVKQRGVNGW